ncbi:MAG TPA: response regulator [Candidatus Acidoferrum sp.]|jgi:two-component system sensor histidine kinase/response regulator|nr:response regulator [Candidatus Acidoferrum sp.]
MSEMPPPKILIVDDETAQMKALCNTLQDHNYKTVGFSSAKAALAELEKTEFDLLLSDLMMPEMNGIELLQAAKKKSPNLVCIIMTGEGTIATAVEAMKSGALDYILKPFKLSAILPVLERALSVRNLRLENAALARRVEERTAELEVANKELEAFSYSVSHDLRAPLRHIIGFTDLLTQAESGSPEQNKRYLGLISTAAKQMNQLIDDLLDFSRNSRVEIRQTQVNLQDLVEKILQDLQPETSNRNIVFEKKSLPSVQGDASLLRQVFSNLILNAVKYSRKRDAAKIEIGCAEKTKNEVTIYVRDNGVGFDMKYADKLFGVFQRLHGQDEFEGTGIGLANVRRIVARHGGRTWAEAKVNEGATFFVTLRPYEPSASSATAT